MFYNKIRLAIKQGARTNKTKEKLTKLMKSRHTKMTRYACMTTADQHDTLANTLEQRTPRHVFLM